MTRTLQVRITGVVQGVGYRAWTEQAARQRGLSGWVRNRRDGSVEALAQGESAAVQALIDWTKRGPPGARVTEVKTSAAEEGAHQAFELRPTV